MRDVIVTFLIQALDDKLLTALAQHPRIAVMRRPLAPLTVEVFLGGLYARYGEEVLKFFKEPDTLRMMAREFFPEVEKGAIPWETLASDRLLEKEFTAFSVGEGQAAGFDIEVDQELIDILWKAAKLSAAAGRIKAGIPEFIGALALEDAVLSKLYKNRGLLLKGHLGPLPD